MRPWEVAVVVLFLLVVMGVLFAFWYAVGSFS